jgi:putative SOS response-associated peptidase YedK
VIQLCGRYTLFTDEEYKEIRRMIKDIQKEQANNIVNMKTGEIFPTNIVPIVTNDENDEKVINLFKWGFPNFKQQNGVIINARGETLEEKQTFKKILYTKRCLIPTTGFYEWKTIGKNKNKYLIRPNKYNFFYMAGLYNTFVDKYGEAYTSFVIITTDANKEMSEIHNRMPILLTSKEEYEGWIDNSLTNLSEIKSYIHPYEYKLSLESISEQLEFKI